MNKWIGIGRLVKDVETRYSASGTAVARFTVAIDDGYGENKKTNFINCIAFGKTGEFCEKYLGKGQQCAIEGKISTGSYENNEGKKVYTTDVVADRVEFVGSKGEKSEKKEDTYEGFAQLDNDDSFLPF